MAKTRGFKRLTQAETRRLRRETKQMWDSVPPHRLASARELAGVEEGKEHEFRAAFVRESGIGVKSEARPEANVIVPDSTPRSELTMEIELGDCVVDGVQHKRLWVRVSCDGAIGQHKHDEPVTAFRDNEHSIRWVHDTIQYLNRYLPERLRTMALLTVREAIAKSSEAHGIAEIDWKTLAKSHADIVAKKVKRTHVVRSGPDGLFKTTQQYLNFLAEAARTCKARGERLTQEWAAEFASEKFSTERGIDERMIRKWNRYFRVDWNWYADKVNRTN
jgi:hypothetical protein